MDNIVVYEEDGEAYEDYLELISYSLNEWNSKNDQEQFEYLENFKKASTKNK